MAYIGKRPTFNTVRYNPISADPVNPVEGEIQFSDGTVREKGFWQYLNGTWARVANPTSTGILDGDNSNFETSLGDWVEYTDAAQATPEDGDGVAAADVLLERTDTLSEVLAGKGSMEFTKANLANAQGQGASLTIDVDKVFRGKPLKLTFDYEMAGTFQFADPSDPVTTPSDLQVYMYDVTNSKLISPDNSMIFGGNRFETLVQLPADCEQARLILHVAGTSTDLWVMFADNFTLDIAPSNFIPTENNYQINTLSADLSSDNFDIADLRFENLVIGKTYRATFQARIGYSNEADHEFTIRHDGNIIAAGSWNYNLNSTADGSMTRTISVIFEATTTTVEFAFDEISGASTLNGNGTQNESWSMLEELNDYLPKQESGQLASLSAKTTFAASGLSANTGYTADTPLTTFENIETDSTNSWNAGTGEYTVKSPGDYIISFSCTTSATGNIVNYVAVNGVEVKRTQGPYSSNGVRGLFGVVLPNLKYGDIITARLNAGTTITGGGNSLYNWINIHKLGSQSQPYAPRTAHIKEQVAANTASGTFTSGAWQTRNLNDQEGDFYSVSSNQITLQPGSYLIEAQATAYRVNGHKIKLRNITDSVDEIVGLNAFADTSFDGQTAAHLKDTLLVSEPKVYEIQHRSTTTQSGNGFGVALNIGVDEVYTQVKITKIL